MSNYRRVRRSGGTFFFTVALQTRGSNVLVEHVEVLRQAVAQTQPERPFEVDAWVVLPDHLHAVWTLPEGDTDYSTRWSAIKARFSRDIRRAGFTPPLAGFGFSVCAGVNPGVLGGSSLCSEV